MPSYLSSQPPWFVFLVHPRDVQDLYLIDGSSVIAEHSASEEEFRDKMLSLPPTVICDVTFGFSPARGELLGVLCMPDQIMHLRGRRLIAEAVQVAAGRGASVIGLGALTAPATRAGTTLLPELPRGVTLTTGNALTAAVARSNVVEASERLDLGNRATVAVVGCTGSVGVPVTHLLAEAGFELVLIGRNVARVERELGELSHQARISGELSDVARADVVLLLTGEASARLAPDMPRQGAVVVDLAHPRNVDPEQYDDFGGRGVRVVQGGLVQIPGYCCPADLRLPDRHSALACLAETYVFAREGIREHAVGRASPEFAQHIERVAARHGVRPRPLDLTPAAVVAA